jgi:hypothetical protein
MLHLSSISQFTNIFLILGIKTQSNMISYSYVVKNSTNDYVITTGRKLPKCK